MCPSSHVIGRLLINLHAVYAILFNFTRATPICIGFVSCWAHHSMLMAFVVLVFFEPLLVAQSWCCIVFERSVLVVLLWCFSSAFWEEFFGLFGVFAWLCIIFQFWNDITKGTFHTGHGGVGVKFVMPSAHCGGSMLFLWHQGHYTLTVVPGMMFMANGMHCGIMLITCRIFVVIE